MTGKEPSEPASYRIELQGNLDSDWSDWFDGLAVTYQEAEDGSSITYLTGVVQDQPALRRLLTKIWDVNLTLISVVRLENASQEESL